MIVLHDQIHTLQKVQCKSPNYFFYKLKFYIFASAEIKQTL